MVPTQGVLPCALLVTSYVAQHSDDDDNGSDDGGDDNGGDDDDDDYGCNGDDVWCY